MIPLGVLASTHVAAASMSGAEYLTYGTSFTGTTTRTFAPLSFGTAASNRNIIVMAHSRTGGVVTGATIGGVTATVHATFSDGYAKIAVISAVVPSGTGGDVTITYASNPEQSTVGLWAAYGTLSYDSYSTNGGGNTLSLTAPSDALVIGGLTQLLVADWALATPAEDYNSGSGNSFMQSLGGCSQPSAGSYTVEVTSGYTSYSNHAFIGVAFTLT